MIGSYDISTDIRVVIAGLACRDAITLPDLIDGTGAAVGGPYATVPTNISAHSALLPHVDYHDVPAARPGAGIVATREAALAPYLAPANLPAILDLPVAMVAIPKKREEIGRWLRWMSGLHWAPGALFALAGWEIDRVTDLLDRCRRGDIEGALIVAERQAALAVRSMWKVIYWSSATSDDLVLLSGAVAVARACIDMVALLGQLLGQTRSAGKADSRAERALGRALEAARRIVKHIVAADKAPSMNVARLKLRTVVSYARRLVEAVGLFSVASEGLHDRWIRLDRHLKKIEVDVYERDVAKELDGIERQLRGMGGAALAEDPGYSAWRPHIRVSLQRLGIPDRATRIDALFAVRTDLIYRLAATRRLDRLHALFPWLAAPHGAFPHCCGGALGAIASLLECGRALEAGRELKLELGDPHVEAAGDRRLAEVSVDRLTVRSARPIYASRRLMFRAAGRATCAGFALAQGAMSHAMVQAQFRGGYFGPLHPISRARFGRLDGDFAGSLKDRRTLQTVIDVERSKLVHQLVSRDDDLPRHMGLTLVRHLAAALYRIFPAGNRQGDFGAHRKEAIDTAAELGRPRPTIERPDRATLELLYSMLKTLDVVQDDTIRDAIAADVTTFEADKGEVGRAERHRIDASGNGLKVVLGRTADHDSNSEAIAPGQGARRIARDDVAAHGDRSLRLDQLTHVASRWSEPANKALPPNGPHADDILEDILLGTANLAQLSPVGDLQIPILWFAPSIDRDRLNWIKRGAPLSAQGVEDPADRPPTQAELISIEVARCHAWAPLLYASAFPTGREDRIMVTLFTGRSPITRDHAHVRKAGG